MSRFTRNAGGAVSGLMPRESLVHSEHIMYGNVPATGFDVNPVRCKEGGEVISTGVNNLLMGILKRLLEGGGKVIEATSLKERKTSERRVYFIKLCPTMMCFLHFLPV